MVGQDHRPVVRSRAGQRALRQPDPQTVVPRHGDEGLDEPGVIVESTGGQEAVLREVLKALNLDAEGSAT